jgi:hypothetical protein
MNKCIVDTVEEICVKWNFSTYVKDEKIMNDIRYALSEALITGIMMGGMDSDLFEEACDLIIEIDGLEKGVDKQEEVR